MCDPDPDEYVARWAGEPPSGISPRRWHRMIRDAAVGIADSQAVENEGTPEECAAAALRAVANEIRKGRG